MIALRDKAGLTKPATPIRSSLFVPGHRAAWIEKAPRHGADLLILDLEDAVPAAEKAAARQVTRAGLTALGAKNQRACVRINGFETGLAHADLDAIVCRELDSVILPKVEAAEELLTLDSLLTALEHRHGLAEGSIATPLLCETARAMRGIFEIVTACRRVTRVTLAAGPGGDAARAIGYQWSKEGVETLYLRSKTVLDCRAAGIQFPDISSWWNIPDIEGLETDARRNRQLGFRGQTVMHPSHVPVVNRIFSPSEQELAWAKGLLAAMEEAAQKGLSATTYEGEMVDEAMAVSARQLLELV